MDCHVRTTGREEPLSLSTVRNADIRRLSDKSDGNINVLMDRPAEQERSTGSRKGSTPTPLRSSTSTSDDDPATKSKIGRDPDQGTGRHSRSTGRTCRRSRASRRQPTTAAGAQECSPATPSARAESATATADDPSHQVTRNVGGRLGAQGASGAPLPAILVARRGGGGSTTVATPESVHEPPLSGVSPLSAPR